MLTRLEEVFQRLATHNLKINSSKLYLFQQDISFLGTASLRRAFLPTQQNTNSLTNDRAENIKELCSYIGCFFTTENFYPISARLLNLFTAYLEKGRTSFGHLNNKII